jgi:hypothetical protein
MAIENFNQNATYLSYVRHHGSEVSWSCDVTEIIN